MVVPSRDDRLNLVRCIVALLMSNDSMLFVRIFPLNAFTFDMYTFTSSIQGNHRQREAEAPFGQRANMPAEGAASGGLGEISSNPRMPRVTANTSDQEQSNPADFCMLRIPLTGREEGTRD